MHMGRMSEKAGEVHRCGKAIGGTQEGAGRI